MSGLDDLIGSLTKGKEGGGQGGGGIEDLLGGLLGGSGGSSGGGGLQDILGGLLGGGSGSSGGGGMGAQAGGGGGGMNVAALAAVIGPLLIKLLKGGGLQKMMQGARASGLSAQADSWVGTGENAPIGPQEIRSVVGEDTVRELAQEAGVPEDEAAGALAQIVPQLVNGLTPNGQLPSDDEVEQLVAKFAG
jgi:uncharacterized protein YidB (DUF937 family)